ncbi:MAG TPA: nitrile hydratase accessory protein [Pseudomonadales bacterium]
MSGAHDEAFAPGDAAAPPMQNGEVVFEAPWQGRVFGMARAMAAAGVFEWDEFRARLIDELATWTPEQPFAYYDHFLHALERVLSERGLVSETALAARLDALARRPPGHDHAHGHDQADRR